MQPLGTTKRILIALSLYPTNNANDASNKCQISLRTVFPIVLFISTLAGLASEMGFVWKYAATNLDECLFSFMASIMSIGSVYTIIIAFSLRHRIPFIFDNLSAIYEASECELSY